MEKTQFRRLLEDHLVPMLSGSEILDARKSLKSRSIVAFENPVSLFVKPDKGTSYRLRLRRSQKWDSTEKQLIEVFINQLREINNAAESSYFDDLISALPRRVLSEFLGIRAQQVLLESIQQFEALASRTYEGRPIVSGLGITGSVSHGPIRLDELWDEDFSMVLANGVDTMYTAGSDGRVFNLAPLPLGKNTLYAPYRFSAVSNWCVGANRVALALNRNGEILLFKNKRLQFAKRRGAWQFYSHQPVLNRFGPGLRTRLKEAIYETCLDVSFARTGGCVAVVRRTNVRRLRDFVDQDDIISDTISTKSKLIEKAIRSRATFSALDRRVRSELVAMDGATIIDHRGNVLAAGAIVKVPSGSRGGGRTAAAQQLSKLGLGIKISSDGPVLGFRKRHIVFTF